jgi:hypothetical protein
MSLQSTAALAISPLHEGSGDGSSSEDRQNLPRLPPLVAVVVTIVLGDLAFLVLCLTHSAPLLLRDLLMVEKSPPP